jgi:hypothetical protein
MVSPRANRLDCILAEASPRIAEHWSSSIQAGLYGFTPSAVARVDELIDMYFQKLKSLPDDAPATAILRGIETLFTGLGEVNSSCDGELLATDERELLVPIIVGAASAAGLNTEEFEGGDPTLEFRSF